MDPNKETTMPTRLRKGHALEVICLIVLQVSSETESRSNSEADTGSSAETYQR